jgi:hypothetical protein
MSAESCRRVAAFAAAAALTLPAMPVSAAPAAAKPGVARESPYVVARRLLDEATARRDAGDLAGEVERLTRARQALLDAPLTDQSDIVWLLSAALRRLWTKDHDVRRLDAEIELLDGYRRSWAATASDASRAEQDLASKAIEEVARLRAAELLREAEARASAGEHPAAIALLERAIGGLAETSGLADPVSRALVDALVAARLAVYSASRDAKDLAAAEAVLVAVRKAWEASSRPDRAGQLAHLDEQIRALRRQPGASLHQAAVDAAASGARQRASELWTEALDSLTASGGLADPLGVTIVEAATASALALVDDAPPRAEDQRELLLAARSLAGKYIERCPGEAHAEAPACAVDRARKCQESLDGLLRPVAPPPPPQKSSPPHRPLLIGGAVLTALGGGGLAAMSAGLGIGARTERELRAAMDQDLYAGIFDRGRQANTIAWVGGVVGGALLVTGVALLAVGVKRRQSAQRAPRSGLAPGQAGVGWVLRF